MIDSKNLPGGGRNNQVEALRVLGAILVVVFHVFYRYNQIYFSDMDFINKYSWCSNFGTLGVLIFILISTWYLVDKPLGSKSVIHILIDKYFRLYPQYIISITITYILSLILPLGDRAVSFFTYIANLTMLEGFIPGCRYVDGAHWYITTLLLLNLWLVSIEHSDKNKRNLYYCFWIIACILTEKVSVLRLLDVFTMSDYAGVVILCSRIKHVCFTRNSGTDFFSSFACMIFAILFIIRNNGWSYLLWCLLFLMLLILCYQHRVSVIDNDKISVVAKFTYSYYLIHQNVAFMLLNVLIYFSKEQKFWYQLIVIVLIIPIAYAIEKLANFIRTYIEHNLKINTK